MDRPARFGARVPAFEVVPYDDGAKLYLERSGHYLNNPLPGAFFAVGAFEATAGLFGDPVASGPIRGLCVIGRPIARMLPQDGTIGEITRLVLDDGFPHGTASGLVRYALDIARRRGFKRVDALQDRTRHTGCVYRKAGMRVREKPRARARWAGRVRCDSATAAALTPKKRWSISLEAAHG